MKKLVRISLLVFVSFCVDTGVTYGQQMVAQLKEQISQFEEVASDPGAPSQLRSINLNVLTDRRAKLHMLLQDQVESLRKYQTNYESHFSAKEKEVVADSIRSLELEIENLRKTTSAFMTSPNTNSAEIAAPAPPSSTAGMTSSTTIMPQTQVAVIRSVPTVFTNANAPVTYATLDLPNAAIFNSTDASRIIIDAINHGILSVPPEYYNSASGQFSSDFNCVIHVLRWSNPTRVTNANGQLDDAQPVLAQNWYLFNNGKGKGPGNQKWSNEDFTSLKRIFGVKKVWLLYIHLNRAPDYRYEQARYDFSVQKKTPANVNNLFSVAQLFISLPAAAGLGAVPEDLWGGDQVDIDYVPSDITITANLVKTIANGPVVAIDKPKTFDNEGRYWWDVSVAVPVRRISQTEFDTTANTVTAKEVDKQNAFALLNLYPVPVDVKGSTFTWIPHFVGGVAIAKQPLKKFLLGAGFGPRFANFYVGAVFTEEKKPTTLKEGDTATPAQLNADLRKRFKPKFSFGFNLPVRGVIESLKKQSK